ncbi:NHP2 [Scenedesmus sp. PABB004]|nr:NHP2 [Scenedesmus sp. PABB004]
MGKVDKADKAGAKAAKLDVPYETRVKHVAVIAKPLADEKLSKKVLKLSKRAAKRKQIKRGVKEVVKAIRKNTKGICVLAGDISPIDVITHIPIVCEDNKVPYIYVPSKEELGASGLSKRPTSCMLILPKPLKGGADDDEQKEFDEAYAENPAPRRRHVAAGAAAEPSSGGPSSSDGPAPWAAPGYLNAVVSRMPEAQQAAAFAAIAAAIAAGTVLNAAALGPAASSVLPGFLQVTRTSWFPLGPIFIAAGVAHFTEEQGFVNMYPHQGAWGIWRLPGSARFHVQWTGVAEIAGGLGLCLGALPLDAVPDWLSPASALGLFFLTIAVTPSNIYMYTHNAPGPLPAEVAPGALPWQGHAARGVMQMLLLSALWGIATAA